MKGHYKSLKVLLSRRIEDLHDGGYEGSVNEDHIFKNVFYKYESGRSSKKYDVTGAINFETDEKMPKNTPICSESDNSVMTVQEDLQTTKEDDRHGGISGELALITRNAPDVEVKRIKVSFGEHSDTNSYLEKVIKSPSPSKEVDSCLFQPATIVTSMVESSEHIGDMVDNNVLGCIDPNDGKICDVKMKVPKKKWKDSSFLEISTDEFSVPPEDSAMNPKPLLRYHTYRLLIAAGWAVGKRNRFHHDERCGEYMFRTPEGRPIREFHRAWKMVGERLYNDAIFVGEYKAIRWTDYTEFQYDLYNTYAEVEELRNSGSTTDLARCWYLLDPFATSVFITKSWTNLKAGKEVNTERGVVNRPERSKSPVKREKPIIITHKREIKRNFRYKDDDFLVSDVLSNQSSNKRPYVKKNKTVLSNQYKRSYVKRNSLVPKAVRKYKTKKGGCRLLPRSVKPSKYCVRTVLSWLIDHGIIYVKESIQYRNPQDNSVVKKGLVNRKGILCQCCKKLICLSEFMNHADFSSNGSCLNLFMKSGKPFTSCLLEAWSNESNVRRSAKRAAVQFMGNDQSDDSCGLCGDGGDLICCDNCLSTFHEACLSTPELPEGSYYCLKCCCGSCGNVVRHKEAPVSNSLKCLQCEHKYHKRCIKGKGIKKKLVGSTWFCGETCEKIHSDLDSRIGRVNPISDGFSWTLLKCIHGDERVNSAQDYVALKAECNLKLAVALTIMEECFVPMVDTRTGIHMIPHVMYNWGSEYVRLNYEGFYTMVLEKDDVLLCVASLRIHGATVAEMPLIATCSRHRRQGMCRRLMNAIEEVLKFSKVEKLVISAIPDLVETWTKRFGFLPLEADEKKSLEKSNLMVFPGTVWLKKPMNQESTQGNHFLDEPHCSQRTFCGGGEIDGSGTSIEAVESDRLDMVAVECKEFLQDGVICDDNKLVEQVSVFSCDISTSKMEGSLLESVCDVKPTLMYNGKDP
nr:increased DNA methylation 1-like [Tanacetum cinerariifolium]